MTTSRLEVPETIPLTKKRRALVSNESSTMLRMRSMCKKSHQHFGERLTEAIYTEVCSKQEASTDTKRRVSTYEMLKFLGVSHSGYRAFLNRKVSPTRQRKETVKKQIQKIYDDSKQNYGTPKITQELRKSGEAIAWHTVSKYMRELSIKSQWIKPWTTTTRDSDFSSDLYNIWHEHFTPERPNAVWCTDNTYIWTQDSFVYLNCVMDLFARKIIAWTLSDVMEVSSVIETINKAKAVQNTDLPLSIHSGRGSQYVSNAWYEATENMQRNYSYKGSPYDNACIESFHSLIKGERLNKFLTQNYKHAYSLVFEYIETFYNTITIVNVKPYALTDAQLYVIL